MKVISGKYKGRVIEGFQMDGTRPTMDRVKESLFAMIQNDLIDSNVLDLFAGSGNLGIEALSQGASMVYFVDQNKVAKKTIQKNLSNIGVLEDYEVFNMDYKKALEEFYEYDIKFDLIFLDPPYDTDYIKKSIDIISKYQLLNNNGKIICETSNINKIVYSSQYEKIKEKKYGDKYVVILKKV